MTAGSKPYQTFEDLDVYKVAREFRKAMYRAVRRLPESEKFIAEGHGRFHYLDQIKFMLNSRGSLEESIDDLNVCADEGYLPENEIAVLKQQGWRVHELINGYIRDLRAQQSDASPRVREDASTDLLSEAALDPL